MCEKWWNKIFLSSENDSILKCVQTIPALPYIAYKVRDLGAGFM